MFFETVNAGYPIFPSQVAPQQNPLVKGWDPLEAAVKLAHERNMELHAWVWVFAAANHRHNQLLGLPSDYLGPVLSAHPDWVMTDITGRKFDSGSSRKAFLDPANPEVRRYLLNLLSEISTRYQVDGIHFDYIRYPFQDPRINRAYGYSATSRRLFQEQHGVDPQTLRAGDRLWSTWTEFRTQQVDEFMEITTRALKAQRPNLVISAAVFPFQRPARLLRLQQNWERWAEQGWVDWLVPMTYAESSSDLQNLTRPLFYEQYLLESTLLLPGIRLLNLPEAVVVDQMQFLRQLPVEGYALFAAENLSPQLQQVFGRTQGTSPNAAIPLPHRRPFQAALVRYQSLEKEWIFLLASGQIAISGGDRQAWLQGSEELTAALQQLATNPSNRNYLKADLALSHFQQGFNRWFQGQAQQNPYQVAGWVNRLATLDRLLNYGERRILRENSTAQGANSR
ncbi:MAG: family 10 glycosylhydrolase [Chloroflexaceae bacterium]|nr:family 10 glycosylhydrolase [Chloroflexaceae bacterium]